MYQIVCKDVCIKPGNEIQILLLFTMKGTNLPIALVGRAFTKSPGDQGPIPGLVVPPCLKLCIIWYRSRVKWSNPGEEAASSSIPWSSSY